MAETWLQSAARNSVFEVLKRLQHGRLTIATKYTNEKSQSVTFGNGTSETDLGIVVVIKSPQVFVRFCQGFDLVRMQSSIDASRSLHTLIGSRRVIYGPRLGVRRFCWTILGMLIFSFCPNDFDDGSHKLISNFRSFT